MNCLFSGAIVCIGGAQKRAGGVASAKYSSMVKMSMAGLSDTLKQRIILTTSQQIFNPLLVQLEVRLPK